MEQGTQLELAMEALERIAQHEKECGERWGEATAELRHLREMAMAHSKRWERLAWFLRRFSDLYVYDSIRNQGNQRT